MRRKTMVSCGILLSLLLFVAIGLWIYLIYLNHWYKQVQTELPETKKRLIALNHATLSQIPSPKEVIEISREDLGINTVYQYGITTAIAYKIDDSSLNMNVKEYYQALLMNLGWVLDDPRSMNFGDQKYYKDKTCIHIITYKENGEEYDLTIYHDFQKQDFSPSLPPMWYVKGIREYGKTIIDTCP